MKYQRSFMKSIWSKKIIGCQILSLVALKNAERKVKLILVQLIKSIIFHSFSALLAFLLEHPNITGGRRNRFIAKIYNRLCKRCLSHSIFPNFNLGLSFYVRNREREHHWHSTGNFSFDLGSFLGYLHDQKSFEPTNLLLTKTGISMKLVKKIIIFFCIHSAFQKCMNCLFHH